MAAHPVAATLVLVGVGFLYCFFPGPYGRFPFGRPKIDFEPRPMLPPAKGVYYDFEKKSFQAWRGQRLGYGFEEAGLRYLAEVEKYPVQSYDPRDVYSRYYHDRQGPRSQATLLLELHRHCRTQKKTGPVTMRGQDGALILEGEFREDERVGQWTWYYPGGERPHVRASYELKDVIGFDEDGKFLPVGTEVMVGIPKFEALPPDDARISWDDLGWFEYQTVTTLGFDPKKDPKFQALLDEMEQLKRSERN